jgi:hypothetical protein
MRKISAEISSVSALTEVTANPFETASFFCRPRAQVYVFFCLYLFA